MFDAWLDRQMVGRFMFGPALREEEVLRIAIDSRVGGEFSFLVRRGEMEIDHVGEYLEIVRPRRLVFTWAVRENLPATSRVSIEIAPLADGCELTLVHELDPAWAAYAERTAAGWTKMLAALEPTLGSG